MKLLKDVFNIFYPDICLCCDKHLTDNEDIICITCRHDLPTTNFSFEPSNTLEKVFYGRVPLAQATSLLYFLKKGNVQHLIHNLKYKGQQQIGTFAGNWLAQEMIESNRFNNLDIIVPVPLHKKKLKKRGYNQATTFGKSLAKALKIKYIENVLIRTTHTETQTKKNRFDRWKNVEHIFNLTNKHTFENKHILLIDDIVTTGATIEACHLALNKSKNIKISIASIAYVK